MHQTQKMKIIKVLLTYGDLLGDGVEGGAALGNHVRLQVLAQRPQPVRDALDKVVQPRQLCGGVGERDQRSESKTTKIARDRQG